MRATAAHALLYLSWLCLLPEGQAEPPRAHLLLERPAASACPTAEDLEEDVEALMGRDVFAPRVDASLDVHCTFDEDDSRVHARLEVKRREGRAVGSRDLTAPAGQCASLRRPLALILLMLLDREPSVDEPLAPTEQPDADEPAGGPAERTQVTAARATRQAGLGASVGVLSGVLPRATPGIGATAVGRPVSSFGIRLDAGYWLPVRAQIEGGGRARFQALTLGLGLCPSLTPPGASVRLALCGGAQAAGILAKPDDLLDAKRAFAAFGQAFLAPELSRRWEQARLAADLGLQVAFTRPKFFLVQGDGSRLDLHQPARLAAIFRLTLIIPGR